MIVERIDYAPIRVALAFTDGSIPVRHPSSTFPIVPGDAL
jgi:hypothetical protein